MWVSTEEPTTIPLESPPMLRLIAIARSAWIRWNIPKCELLLIQSLDAICLVALHGAPHERAEAERLYQSIPHEVTNGRLDLLERAASSMKRRWERRHAVQREPPMGGWP